MFTAVFYEDRHRGEYIKSEAKGLRSRDAATIAAGSGIVKPGQVLGRVTATGKYVPQKTTATDGSQVAAAIAYAWVDATLVDEPVTITARDSEVFGQRLTYDPSVATPQAFADAAAALAARGIILR